MSVGDLSKFKMPENEDQMEQKARQVALLQRNYFHWTGRYLFDPQKNSAQAVVWLEHAALLWYRTISGLIRYSTMPIAPRCSCLA